MALQLSDDSWVEPGSRIGALPVLADQRLAKGSSFLHSSTHPRMDLVVLLSKDEAAATAAAAAPKGGMSAAQRALMQRMLAQRAGQAAGPAAAPEPSRGPKINMEVWRLGDDRSCVWQVPLTADKLLDHEPGSAAAKAAEQESEDICVHEVCWSPDGDRLAVLFSVRRLRAMPSSDVLVPRGRYVTVVRTFSVHDGRICSTTFLHAAREIHKDGQVDMFRSPRQLSWHPANTRGIASAYKGRNSADTERQLARLHPLPPVPSADEFVSGSSTANLMPHQIRMMQMSGAKMAQSTFELPSSIGAAGRGPLSAYPWLAKAGHELGLVERGDGASDSGPAFASTATQANRDRNGNGNGSGRGGGSAPLDLEARTVLCVTCSKTSRVYLLLAGSVHLGSFLSGCRYSQPDVYRYISTQVSPNLSKIVLSHTSDFCPAKNDTGDEGQPSVIVRTVEAKLPIKQSGKVSPKSTVHLMNRLSCLGHLLGIYAGYTLDIATIVQQIWNKEIQQGVIDEWTNLTKDLEAKFGCDYKYELLNSLLSGKASPAVEMLLLANLTEGVLTRFEQMAFNAFNKLKQLLHASLRPALERILIVLKEWQGLYRYFRLYNFGGLEDDMPRREASDSDSTQPSGGFPDFSDESDQAFFGSGAAAAKKHSRLPNAFIRAIQECLDTCLSLAELIEVQSVTVEEFFRYCRYEKERQEGLKQDQQEPRLAINHDVATVAQFLERGFVPSDIKRLLQGNGAAAVPQTQAAVADNAGLEAAGVEHSRGEAEADDDDDDLDVDDDDGDVDVEVAEAGALDVMLARARAHLGKIEALAAQSGKATAAVVSTPAPGSAKRGKDAGSTGLLSTSPTSTGLLSVLSTVVTEMGEMLREILSESLAKVVVKDTSEPAIALFDDLIDIEDTVNGPISQRIVVRRGAAIESLADARSSSSLAKTSASPMLYKVVGVSGRDRFCHGDFDEHFVAFCARAQFGYDSDGAGDASTSVATGTKEEASIDRLIVMSWTSSMPKIEHQHPSFARKSAHLFEGRARSTTILDYTFFDRHEVVLLLRLSRDLPSSSTTVSTTTGTSSGHGAPRGRKRKTDASHSTSDSTHISEQEDGYRYFVGTFRHDQLCRRDTSSSDEKTDTYTLKFERVSELHPGFQAAEMSISCIGSASRGRPKKRTLAIVNRQADRIVYLDLTRDEEINSDADETGHL